MSKKHFEAFAQFFGNLLARTKDIKQRELILLIVREFGIICMRFNQRFDMEKFINKVKEVERTWR